MRKNPRRILSPQRLPFRHPGAGTTNLTNTPGSCNTLPKVKELSRQVRLELPPAFQEMIRHNTRRFHNSLFFHANHQPQELRHAPCQRRGAARSPAKHKSRSRRLRLIPHLLRNHSTLVREMQHRRQIRCRIVPRGNFILAALSRKNRPDPTDALPLPRSAKIRFAITVVAVTVKRRPVRSPPSAE